MRRRWLKSLRGLREKFYFHVEELFLDNRVKSWTTAGFKR
jgi:hypothetical protein